MEKKQFAKEESQMFPRMPQYDIDENDDEEDCVEMPMTMKRSSKSSGGSGHSSCAKYPPQKKPRQKGPLDMYYTPNPEEVIKGRKNGGGRQQTINEVCRKELRDKACREIARWFYDADIPFNAVTYDSFPIMVEAIGQFGPGMKPPTMHEIRVPLLKKEVGDIQTILNEHKREWVQKGCSILSDGWRDSVVHKDIVNFLVNSPKGSIFIKSMDVSEVVKDANLLYQMLDDMVEEVGEENVQVVTDNAPNYVKAGKLLEAKRPHLYWTPCAAHCIDLMLEDLGNIAKIRSVLQKAMFVNGYIYNHVKLVNLMRRFTMQKNLHRPAITRFATSFITLAQIHKQKDNLRKMVTSQEYSKDWMKDLAGKKVATYLLQDSFWRNIVYALKLIGPLVKVLRLVDGEKKPAMGYIYEAMDRAKEAIATSFAHRDEHYKKAFEIIDVRWDCQLHRPLHGAGYFLNPEMYYENPENACCEEVMKGLYDCISRLVPDLTIQDKIGQELDAYQNAEGLFGLPMAVRQRKLRASADWWHAYGSSTPNLQKLAIRILSLTCSATSCERNWGVFQHSFLDLQFPNGQVTYVSGEGLSTSAFLPLCGGLLQTQGQYPGEMKFSFSCKNKWGTRITPMLQWPDKSFALGLDLALAWRRSGLLVKPTIQFSLCPTFGGSCPGLRMELAHSVKEELNLICGCSLVTHPSAFASVSVGRSKWNGKVGNTGVVLKIETPLGNYIRPSFSVQLNSGIEL